MAKEGEGEDEGKGDVDDKKSSNKRMTEREGGRVEVHPTRRPLAPTVVADRSRLHYGIARLRPSVRPHPVRRAGGRDSGKIIWRGK